MPIKFSNTNIITPGTPSIPTTRAVMIFIGIAIPNDPPNLFNSHKITIPNTIFIINSISLLKFIFRTNFAINNTITATNIIVR